MPRTYGTTNVMPYAAAPAVGLAGDEYYNTTTKQLLLSDGTVWNPVGGQSAPYAPVQGTPPPASSPTITPPEGLLWVDTSTSPTAPSAFPLSDTAPSNRYEYQTNMTGDTSARFIIDAAGTLTWYNGAGALTGRIQAGFLGLPAPVTSGSGTQTYTDPYGDVWVAANGVNSGNWKKARDVLHAAVYRNAAFTTPTTNGVFAFDTVQEDPYYLCGTTPNATLFTIPLTGLWQMNYTIAMSATAAGQYVTCSVYRNGTMVRQNNRVISISGGLVVDIVTVRPLQLGDQIQLYYWTSTGLVGLTGPTNCWGEIKYEGTG